MSATTVSHVVSGKRPVKDATAARVRDAMRALDYVPNHAAKSLRSGTTHTIGLLVPDISNPYFAELAKGAEDAAEAHGMNVVLCNTDFNHDREARYLTVLRGGAFDGMIYVAGAPPLTSRLAELARSFPLAIADEELEGVPAVTVLGDNLRGGRLVGEHLAALHHDRVLYIGGPPSLLSSPRRLEGLRQGLGPGAVVSERSGDYREQSGFEAVRRELDAGERRFSAIFAGNDLMALGAIRALGAAGIGVPDRVSVVGYDDVSLARLVSPPLTTVRQPVYGIGRRAAEELILLTRDDAGERAPARLVLDVELVVRGTTSPARGVAGA